jgi:hypothetical protein
MPRILSILALVAGLAAAQDPQAREQSTAELAHGKATVAYGAPVWRDTHLEQVRPGAIWRLGSNDPTTLRLACALVTRQGGVPAGDYKLALRCTAEDACELVVYDGPGFHNDGLMSWTIPASRMTREGTTAAKLAITIDGGASTLAVRFGPLAAEFPLRSAAMNETFTTRFRNIPVTISTVALASDGLVQGACVGVASATQNNQTLRYWLTLRHGEGEPVLGFRNAAALSLPQEKEAIERRIARMQEILASAPDRKEAIEARLAAQKEELQRLTASAAVYDRYVAEHAVTGTSESRPEPAPTLAARFERPEGSLVAILGLGAKDLRFEIDPRLFLRMNR